VQRGTILTKTPQVVALVLNVGEQCMGTVYKDPNEARDFKIGYGRLKSIVKA